MARSLLVVAGTFLGPALLGQGPTLTYLADPGTELSFAHAYVHLDGGSRHRLPFLPVICRTGAPCGTAKYTTDIRIDAPVAFVGNGIVRQGQADCYRGMDVAGKIVLFSYDFPDAQHAALEKEVSLADRIREAAARHAAGVIAFSWSDEQPFHVADAPEIPAIAVNRRSAEFVFHAAGRNPADIFDAWKADGSFSPEILIAKLDLRIDGKFDSIVTDHFTLRFEPGRIPKDKMTALAAVNEKSITFITELFKAEKLRWEKSFVAYFRDFDSKLFYVRHWGRGYSSDMGVFMVFDGSVPDFGLAVHENAHTLIGRNWGDSSSFLNEGLGKYAETMATDPARNHRAVAGLVHEKKLVPLAQMLDIDIGSDKLTGIAYPASGSFVQYLIDTYSLARLKTAFVLEARTKGDKAKQDTWTTAFGKPIAGLEQEWLAWIGEHYGK